MVEKNDDKEPEEQEKDIVKMKGILAYTESNYFGDSDIFALKLGYTDPSDGRDMTALSTSDDCSVFCLNKKAFVLIEHQFKSIYDDMEK